MIYPAVVDKDVKNYFTKNALKNTRAKRKIMTTIEISITFTGLEIRTEELVLYVLYLRGNAAHNKHC